MLNSTSRVKRTSMIQDTAKHPNILRLIHPTSCCRSTSARCWTVMRNWQPSWLEISPWDLPCRIYCKWWTKTTQASMTFSTCPWILKLCATEDSLTSILLTPCCCLISTWNSTTLGGKIALPVVTPLRLVYWITPRSKEKLPIYNNFRTKTLWSFKKTASAQLFWIRPHQPIFSWSKSRTTTKRSYLKIPHLWVTFWKFLRSKTTPTVCLWIQTLDPTLTNCSILNHQSHRLGSQHLRTRLLCHRR